MYMQYVTEYTVTNISDTRPQTNMITMGKIDTSDLMMIITWAVKYILSIAWTEMDQLNTYNPLYFNDKGNHRED